MTVAREPRRELGCLEVEFLDGTDARFLGDDRVGVALPVRWLEGDRSECLCDHVSPAGAGHGFRLYAAQGLLIGCTLQPLGGGLEDTALGIYRRLIRAAQGRRLYRIWNYVPAINRVTAGLENYRAFNAGRSRAFEEAFGADSNGLLPAAPAVGCAGETVATIFMAGDQEPRHCENPDQVPSYSYPSEHGPRPPSFSRATVIGEGALKRIFISGTSAIKGHSTVAAGSTAEQIACTVHNLRLISREAGAGDDLGGAMHMARRFKVYLRHPSDLPLSRQILGASLFRPDDRIAWVQADLCREALNVEVEATLSAAQ